MGQIVLRGRAKISLSEPGFSATKAAVQRSFRRTSEMPWYRHIIGRSFALFVVADKDSPGN